MMYLLFEKLNKGSEGVADSNTSTRTSMRFPHAGDIRRVANGRTGKREPVNSIPAERGICASLSYAEYNVPAMPLSENETSTEGGSFVRLIPAAYQNPAISGIVASLDALVQTVHNQRHLADVSLVSRRLRFASRNRSFLNFSPKRERKTRKTMHLRNMIGALVTVAATSIALSAPANAQTFATIQSKNGTTPFSYVTGAAGGLNISTSATVFLANSSLPVTPQVDATVVFTGLNNVGTVSGIEQTLSGGTFTITQNGGGPVLLQGTFTGATLFAVGPTGGVFQSTMQSVTYTGGTYFAASGLDNPGNLSFNFTSVSPTPTIVGGYYTNFNASGSGTFSASLAAVPEPGEYAVMGMAGLTVCGLIVRARRRRSVGGMAA